MYPFPELPEDLYELERRQDDVLRKLQQKQTAKNVVRYKAEYDRRNLLLEKIQGKRKPDPAIMKEIANLNEKIEEGRQILDLDLVRAGVEAQLVYYREVVKFLEGIVNG